MLKINYFFMIQCTIAFNDPVILCTVYQCTILIDLYLVLHLKTCIDQSNNTFSNNIFGKKIYSKIYVINQISKCMIIYLINLSEISKITSNSFCRSVSKDRHK